MSPPLRHSSPGASSPFSRDVGPRSRSISKHIDDDLAYYQGAATEIEYPDVEAKRLADVARAKRPGRCRTGIPTTSGSSP